MKRKDRPASETPEFLTIKQAAEKLNVSDRTIYDLCRAGKIAHSRIGIARGTIRITARAFQEFVDAAEVKPPPVLKGGLAELMSM